MKFGSQIAVFLFFILGFTQPSLGASDPVVGTAEFEKAKDLYIEATPLDMTSPKRAELLKQAQEILTKLIEDNPDTLEARRKLLGVHLLQNDYSNGIRVLQKAITLSPNDPKMYISMAFLYEHTGALNRSKAMLNFVLKELDPENAIAQEYMTVIQTKIDALEKNMGAHGDMMQDPHANMDKGSSYKGDTKWWETGSPDDPHGALKK